VLSNQVLGKAQGNAFGVFRIGKEDASEPAIGNAECLLDGEGSSVGGGVGGILEELVQAFQVENVLVREPVIRWGFGESAAFGLRRIEYPHVVMDKADDD